LPGLMLPFNSVKQSTNGYAFIIRVQPDEAGIKADEGKFKDAVIDALKAEGVPVNSARWLLPAHTIIQAKNGYGKGCPWSCSHARQNIDYSLEQYPISLKAVNTSIQIAINGHRPPNGEVETDYIIEGVRKVFENPDQVLIPNTCYREGQN